MKRFASREAGVGAFLVLTLLMVQAVNPRFLSPRNLQDLLVQAAPFAIMACGMTVVVLLGEVDISIGSMAGTLAALLGLASSASHWGLPIPASVAVVCLVGALLGGLNGVLVAYLGVPSIIATLGLLTVLKGVTQVLLGGTWITDLPPGLRTLGTGAVMGVPVPVMVAAAVVAMTGWLLAVTPFGLRVYAIGCDSEAARTRGLSAKPVKLVAFALLGLFTGVAVLVSAPQLSVVESGFGRDWELFVVTCVVVGGVSIKGGVGSLWGALLGVLLLSIVRTALIYLKLGDQATYWERAIQGAFILGATLADRVSTLRKRAGVTG